MENFTALLAEFKNNMKGKESKLIQLLATLDLMKLGEQLREQREKEVYNYVLAEYEFFASESCERAGINVGERITDEENLYLLSSEDFNKVLELAAPIMFAKQITDENGYYLDDWTGKKVEAHKNLVEFILDIVPVSMRGVLEECRYNVVYADKLINAFRSSLKKS